MEMKKLLIADAGEEFRMALQDYLCDRYIIQVCKEGNETLQLMESFRPDVVILDLLLPGVDGVTLLQKAAERGLCPTVLATTRFFSDYVLEAMERLAVGYVMVKPCELSAVAARLSDLMQREEDACEVTKPDMRTVVDNVLRELSFQTHPRGYATLREALLETIRSPGQQVTKTLYPTIGKLCGGNAEQVEHAIRRVIHQAWTYRNQEVWDSYFGVGSDGKTTKCPTNKVFIMTVASRIVAENQNMRTSLQKIG